MEIVSFCGKWGGAHKIDLLKKNEGCSKRIRITRIHSWTNGEFIALGDNFSENEDACQYAMLDTMLNTLTYKHLDTALEWIKDCNDVRGWKNDVYCLALLGRPQNLYLKKK